MANINVQTRQGASGIDVNTTPVTNGATGRVFFQKSDATVGQDERFTYDAALKRLTLRAGGALSSDLPFAIRDSGDTGNLVEVRGNGQAFIGNSIVAYPSLRTQGSQGAYNWVTSSNSTIALYNEGSAFQGLYYSPGSTFLFLNGSSGSAIVGRIGSNGNWLIEANPYTAAGIEADMRFGIVSKGITEASGTCFKLKHLDTVTEAIVFTSLNCTNDGYLIQRINTADINSSRLENQQMSFSIDEATDVVTLKIKKSNGTVITKTI
jgi:hypothetical protein